MKEQLTNIALEFVVSPKRTRKGNKYVLVIMDYAAKWPEAFPLCNILAETIVECLVEVTPRLCVLQNFCWIMGLTCFEDNETFLHIDRDETNLDSTLPFSNRRNGGNI